MNIHRIYLLVGTLLALPIKADNIYKIQPHAFHKVGNHLIAELTECSNLNNPDSLAIELRKAAEAAGATVLLVKTHQFAPQGVTGIAVLSESHISVHTWPEYGYAAVDIFTCGAHVNPDKALVSLAKYFQAKKQARLPLDRGFKHKQ